MKDLKHFLEFANFYRKFIPHFSECTRSQSQLIKEKLQVCMVYSRTNSIPGTEKLSTSQQLHEDSMHKFMVQTNALMWQLERFFSRKRKTGAYPPPYAFYFKLLLLVGQNHNIFSKDFLAIKISIPTLAVLHGKNCPSSTGM